MQFTCNIFYIKCFNLNLNTLNNVKKAILFQFRVNLLEETIRDLDCRNEERLIEEQKKYREVKVSFRF